MAGGIPTDIAVQLYLNGAWSDVVTDERGEITYTNGYGDASTTLTSSRLSFSLNNRNGAYSPRNAAGPNYGYLKRNTLARVLAGYGTAPAYRSVATVASGTSATATCTKPAGTTQGDTLIVFHSADSGLTDDMAEPSNGPWRLLLDNEAGFPVVRMWWKRAGASEPASYTFKQTATQDSTIIMVAVSGGLGRPIVTSTFDRTSSSSIVVPTADPSNSNDVELCFASTAGNATFTPPGTLTERADFSSGGFVSSTLATRTLSASTATGTSTFTLSGALFERCGVNVLVSNRTVAAQGGIREWPQKWVPGGVDVWVPIEAAGITSRLKSAIDTSALNSADYRLSSRAPADIYFPMEEESGATLFSPYLTSQPTMSYTGTVTMASDSTFPGSAALPLFAASANWFWQQARPTPDPTFWQIQFLLKIATEPGGATDIFGWAQYSTALTWRITCVPGAPAILTLTVYNAAGSSLGACSVNFIDDASAEIFNRCTAIRVTATENGANVNITFNLQMVGSDGVTVYSTTNTMTINTVTVGNVFEFSKTAASVAMTMGHVGVYTSNTGSAANVTSFLSGYGGEQAGNRLVRLLDEENITSVVIGDTESITSGTDLMGPQETKTTWALLEDCANVDMGLLYEPHDVDAIGYRTRQSMQNQTALALSYTSSHLSGLDPTEDDRELVNASIVSRAGGSSARSELTTGTLGSANPPTGVGLYERKYTGSDINAYRDSQLAGMADYQRRIGTQDVARLSSVVVELGRTPFVADLNLSKQIIEIEIGDLISISSPPAWMGYDTAYAIVKGYTITMSAKTWRYDLTTSPGTAFTFAKLDDTTYGRLDSNETTLMQALTSGATSAFFAVGGPTAPAYTTYPTFYSALSLWSTTSTPYPVAIEGERATVTAMTAPAASFVAAGTVANAVNASVTPALPAGVVTGDLLLVFAAIRNSGTGVPVAPTGYSTLLTFGNMALFGKLHTGTESAPTVTFTGGAALADTTAQMAAFRATQLYAVTSATVLSGSAANIAYPACSVIRDRCVALYLGWRQSAWTSVATLSGAVEIGDLTTSAGSGQGLVWDYVIQTTHTDVATGSFVVTGGVNGISRGAIVVLAGDVQTATLTRSVNGVIKAQAAGVAVHVADPAVVAL